MSDQDKTEEATPHRLEEAREKGDVANSREFANFILFVGLALSLYFHGKTMLQKIADLLRLSLDPGRFHIVTSGELMTTTSFFVREMIWILGPLFATVFLFGVAGYISQIGFLFTTQKLVPQFSKINPISGFSRIFSKETAMELVKSIAKLIILTSIVYALFHGEVNRMNEIGAQPVSKSFIYLIETLGRLFMAMLIFMAVLGVLDFGFQKWAYAQKMKMSFQEVKEEHKMRDGDPHIRARIRQIQRDLARKRMMEEVPKADVVVTNPTHVAVALRYKRGESRAPLVVAKGAGLIALKIKERAMLAQIPIVEKRELARYIYQNIEVGQMIPESLYGAVAEVLAYIYKIKKKFRAMVARDVANG